MKRCDQSDQRSAGGKRDVMISRSLRWFSACERHRIKTIGHPLRNLAIRRLHLQGVSIRKLARGFGLSPTRVWEVVHGQGARVAEGPTPPGTTIDTAGTPK